MTRVTTRNDLRTLCLYLFCPVDGPFIPFTLHSEGGGAPSVVRTVPVCFIELLPLPVTSCSFGRCSLMSDGEGRLPKIFYSKTRGETNDRSNDLKSYELCLNFP